MSDLSVRVVKGLNGAPLSIWMALMLAGESPVNQAWLERNTGYTDKPVRQALEYLEEHGFAVRVGRGWMISDKNRLSFQPDSHIDQQSEPPEMAEDQQNSDPVGQDRNNSDSPISIINKDFKDSNDLNNTNNGSRNNSGISPNYAQYPEVGQALLALGIRENVRTRRLLGRITPRDVRTMVSRLQDDPFHDLNETGLMVTILESMADRKQRRGGYESWNT